MTAGLSMITFCQFFGGTLFIAGAQTIFINELPITLHQYAPALGASIASSNSTSGGSASFNPTTTVIPPAILPGVLLAYNQSERAAVSWPVLEWASISLGLQLLPVVPVLAVLEVQAPVLVQVQVQVAPVRVLEAMLTRRHKY
jgi:hypothetical protein